MKRGLELVGVWIAGFVLIAFIQYGLVFSIGLEHPFCVAAYYPVILLTPGPGGNGYASRGMMGCVLGVLVYSMLATSWITYLVDRKDRRS